MAVCKVLHTARAMLYCTAQDYHQSHHGYITGTKYVCATCNWVLVVYIEYFVPARL